VQQASRIVERLQIGVLDGSEVEEALDVVARAFLDNPVNVAALGEDSERRQRIVYRFFAVWVTVKDFSHTLVARSADGTIVGVCGMLPPGDCSPTLAEKLRMMPRLLSLGPRTLGRMMRWKGVWNKHHPTERHWHLGPVVVDPRVQGMGVGSQLMRAFCEQMDAAEEDAYLETDKEKNVRFYERFGFEVVSEEEVLGTPNWFMLRWPQQRSYKSG
jgi:ribosomal protein S18 acetylase RimI-like enzyme